MENKKKKYSSDYHRFEVVDGMKIVDFVVIVWWYFDLGIEKCATPKLYELGSQI